jgi:hypothetical protein
LITRKIEGRRHRLEVVMRLAHGSRLFGCLPFSAAFLYWGDDHVGRPKSPESLAESRQSNEAGVVNGAAVHEVAGPSVEEAARHLAAALAKVGTLHFGSEREHYRVLLARAIEHAERALVLLAAEGTTPATVQAAESGVRATSAEARSILVTAYAAKVEDALHGAGQLSRSAQRAPTLEACHDGWQRVEEIVAGAEQAARSADVRTAELERDAPGSALARRARSAAGTVEARASAARRIVTERNHAYTFHTDAGFSFGEGWYLAAAAVLAGAVIQIEPGKDGTARAERFLRDAGVGDRLQPYRSRPRAMKQTTELVSRAFRSDPASAQRRLRTAFLGSAPASDAVKAYADHQLQSHAASTKKALIWLRDGTHHPLRNTTFSELSELTTCVQAAGLLPIWIGDALRGERVPVGVVDMLLFWKDPIFRELDMRRAQLQFFEHLKERHGLVGQLGVTTAGMDGPALLGLPTLYLTDVSNVRMREWVGRVPGYEEVVRTSGYLERVSRALSAWARG